MSKITDRFIELIDFCIPSKTKFKSLEDMSGIPAVSWRKAYTRGQRPTVEMIEMLSMIWPRYAFWLATGIADSDHGHQRPDAEMIDIWTRDEEGKAIIKRSFRKRDRTAAYSYFDKCIHLSRLRSKQEGDIDLSLSQKRVEHFYSLLQEAYREKKIREEQERSLVKIENEEIEASLTKRDKLDYVSFEDFDLSIQLKNFGASKD